MSFALLAASLVGCGGDDGASGPCLNVRSLKVTPTPPAKVQMFFTVDTCEGAPVTGLASSDITVKEDGKTVPSSDSQQRLVRAESSFRSYTILVMDVTASVVRGDQLAAVQAGAHDLVNNLAAPEQYIGIYKFDGRAKLQMVQAFTNDATNLNLSIDRIANKECDGPTMCTEPDHNACVTGSGTGLCLDDSRNLYGAVVEGITTLDNAIKADTVAPFKIGSLVLFTGGADQAGRVQVGAAQDKANGSSDFLFTVGIGADADNAFLRTVGKTGNLMVATAGDLGGAMVTFAGKVKEETGRHYLLEYCSPKRNGTHELQVTAKKGTASGFVSSTFKADGFTSGCTLN